MDDNKFREKIYNPYIDLWKIIKLLQHCSSNSGDWNLYAREYQRFVNEHGNTSYGSHLAACLLNVADDIKEMNNHEV